MFSWAPFGSYVVLSSPAGRETYSHKHLVRVNATTGRWRALTQDKRWADIEPAVSPNGKRTAFVRGRAQESSVRSMPVMLIASRQIYVMDANATRVRRLTLLPGWTDEAPTWSRDGQSVLFGRWHRELKGKAAEAELWEVSADGTNARRLAPLDLPSSFLNGFGYYCVFNWQGLFDVAR